MPLKLMKTTLCYLERNLQWLRFETGHMKVTPIIWYYCCSCCLIAEADNSPIATYFFPGAMWLESLEITMSTWTIYVSASLNFMNPVHMSLITCRYNRAVLIIIHLKYWLCYEYDVVDVWIRWHMSKLSVLRKICISGLQTEPWYTFTSLPRC